VPHTPHQLARLIVPVPSESAPVQRERPAIYLESGDTPVRSHTPVTVARPRRAQEVSLIALSPGEHGTMSRHNRSMGRGLQRPAMVAAFLYLLGPFAYAALRILFRVHLHHDERFAHLRNRSGVFALRHFYEIDPFVSFYGAAWRQALRWRHMVAYSLASRVWTRTPAMRTISWIFGVMGLSRGLGAEQSATERAVELLRGPEPVTMAIYPTGPIGRSERFNIRPGVGYLAVKCPDLPVFPVTLVGVQHLKLRDLLLWRRPRVDISIGQPFYGRELRGVTEEDRMEHACELVAAGWAHEEQAIAALHRVSGTPSPSLV
jgi:1-acyl-sn-glycerol-3-phosphate acyltransferase